MRDQQELRNKASSLKIALIDRSIRIEEMSQAMGKKLAGLAPDISQDRFDTMKIQVDNAVARQNVDGLIYATLRWALDITDDIDADDLGLNE